MKKQRKKIVAIVMCIALLVCLMPGIQAKAVTQSSVTSQLNSMMNQYVNRTATSSQMYMGSQCKGFANWVFKQLFGVYIGPYPENANYKITNANAGLVGMIDPGGLTESTSKALLQKAKPGDYIQVQRSIAKSGGRCGPHSMIVVGVKSDGVQVFDCNSDGRNTIKTYLYTWSKFDYDNRAMSLYHAYGYQADSSGGSGSTALPDTRLHVWFSLDPMGNQANNIRLRDMVYLCYRLETTDGSLLDSNVGNYKVKETLYFPDGSTVPHTYEKSNNNWIRSNFDQWGTYRGVVELSGDYTGKVEVSYTIAKPKQVLFNAWFSSAKMGSDASYLEKGKMYYLCYSISYGDSGYLNKYANMNYSVKQVVYGPDGKKVHEYTYDSSDNNWIGFTPTQSGNYKGIITITGDFNVNHSVVCPCKDTTVTKPVQLQSIRVTKQPQKISYTVGEPLNTNGMVVTAKYSDGKTKTVSNYKVSGSTNQAGQSKVTVSYTENGITKTAYYTITVKEKAVPQETVVLSYNPNGGSLSQTRQTGMKNSYITLLTEQPYKTVTVTFDANGGNRTPDQLVLRQKFVGWLYNAESGLKCYSSGSRFLLKGNCTLTAYYGKAVIKTLPDVQRSGYRFDGWYTSGDVKAYAGMSLKNDLKLTAHWVRDESKDNIKPENPDTPNIITPEIPNITDNTNAGNSDVIDNTTPENPDVADDIIPENSDMDDHNLPENPDVIDDSIPKIPNIADQREAGDIDEGDDSFDDWNGENDSDDPDAPDELAAVGDEIIADDVIYTVTKIKGMPCAEYTEAIDEDAGSVVIPDKITVDGVTYQVTSVASKAFYKNTSIKMLSVGKYVTQIGNKAFYGCTSLKRIVIHSKKIKNGGIAAKAFAKIAKKAKIYVPRAKYKSYKKMLKRAGVGTKVRIYKR